VVVLRILRVSDSPLAELAESVASDQVIISIAAHVSMLAHYSDVRLAGNRRALDLEAKHSPHWVRLLILTPTITANGVRDHGARSQATLHIKLPPNL
jgi:hypothetical protein